MNQKEKKRLLSVGAIPAAGNIDEFIEKRMQAKFPKLYPDDEAKKTMLRKDNAEIDAFMKRYEKDKNLTDEFRLFIRSVNGSTKQEHINSLIENKPAVDSRHLRTAYAELAPNVDLSQDFDCPSCGMQEEVNIPFTTEFFWPK